MRLLRVSDNRRFLVHGDGTPFFYLGDTAWELFHRCTLDEAVRYLEDRAAKRFTVIQAVVLAEIDGLHTPNTQGDLPLTDDDPSRPNEAYFKHVDTIVDAAAALGLYIGMLPTWGDKWNQEWGLGPEVFTPESARAFGTFLGRRYSDSPVIWILGGDRPIETPQHRSIVRALAEGLRAGDGGRGLMSFHTWGQHSSSEYVHDEPWLDFHMCQSGHSRNFENWRFIESDYARAPTRPCMDAEPGYEDMPSGLHSLDGGYLDDYDVRKSLYWALFAGAHGHTYGCNPVWQMWRPGRAPLLWARRSWQAALELPGSSQMQHARALLLSRPFLTRIPDQSLLASDAGAGTHHMRATRDRSGGYAMVYIPSGREVELDLEKLSGERVDAHWFDPRTGVSRSIGTFPREDRMSFTPPGGGPDWVLVLDDAARGFSPPGCR
ncbi:MAG: glycoside hydrolase family 140 protein [Chloroflexota bacterium]|nr:glycoside hydrolase family 140 protein [Chloroflexota bacterium]